MQTPHNLKLVFKRGGFKSPEVHILIKEDKLDQDIANILLDKHDLKYPLQSHKLCLNISLRRYNNVSYVKEVRKLRKIALQNI